MDANLIDKTVDQVISMKEGSLTFVASLVIGYMFKGWSKFPNRMIPVVLPIISGAMYSILVGLSFDAFIRGFVLGGLSVWGHQLIAGNQEVISKVPVLGKLVKKDGEQDPVTDEKQDQPPGS
jgi:hypothetical protein